MFSCVTASHAAGGNLNPTWSPVTMHFLKSIYCHFFRPTHPDSGINPFDALIISPNLKLIKDSKLEYEPITLTRQLSKQAEYVVTVNDIKTGTIRMDYHGGFYITWQININHLTKARLVKIINNMIDAQTKLIVQKIEQNAELVSTTISEISGNKDLPDHTRVISSS